MGPLRERWSGLWPAAGLLLLVMLLSPLSSSPLGLMAIVGVPTAVAILTFEPPQSGSAALALLLLAGAGLGFQEAGPPWFIERGWAVLLAGGFAFGTALGPDRPVFDRSLAAVAIAGATVAALAVLRPGLPADLDWQITAQFSRALAVVDFNAWGGRPVEATVRGIVSAWEAVYPALLALASISALGVAAYILGRIRGERRPLPPLREFRFGDHLVWVLVLGLALLVLPAGAWAERTGGNMVTVMGGLYLLRGLAVLVWLGASVLSSGWAIGAWVLAALVLYPVTAGAALVMGISDTWLDLRSRPGMKTDGA
ncbi:DUF2232 domain-containing protein [Candidatus Palauibacter polyketidifaciens]|uniref:DUF2232 domain-containing protein n=1 Tax=Candidatus Palauibacter polyketidifaciens TaxID=3056740 RepID=UPI00139AFDAE|nr:DUF2232 domain-containing protein [Candidatus Palauibacter polyketidifaciens]MDE2721446.1 DUF2232 domain-containing protein [Candidatus Palauibacter polyketidifaciens]MYE34995.1 DUF2232 domain-containing protein [Gemmatimonadales bacterium]